MALFDSTDEVTVETLVGEGKKYKDVNELAKAYAHAATAIEDRERQLTGLREDLSTRLSVEDQLKQFQKGTNNPNEPPANIQTPNAPNGDQDLAKRIREVMDAANRENSSKANQEIVLSRLTELFGTPDKVGQVVRAKAAELGVSVAFLESIAVQSPKAFFAQLGIDTSQAQRPNAPASGGVNTMALGVHAGAPKEGTYEFFEEMRKANPTKFWDSKTQMKIHRAAEDGTYVVPDTPW